MKRLNSYLHFRLYYFFVSTFEIGITDHTNILPASLISPMGTESSSYDYSIFDRADVSADSLLDVWADEMN